MTFNNIYRNSSYVLWEDSRRTIVLKDRGEPRQYIGDNIQRKFVNAYKIDGGVVANGERCDFALCVNDTALYFIELKGGDYSKALSQILTTIESLVIRPGIKTSEVHVRIVLSRMSVPNMKLTGEKKLEKLLKNLNGDLKKASQRMKDSL